MVARNRTVDYLCVYLFDLTIYLKTLVRRVSLFVSFQQRVRRFKRRIVVERLSVVFLVTQSYYLSSCRGSARRFLDTRSRMHAWTSNGDAALPNDGRAGHYR